MFDFRFYEVFREPEYVSRLLDGLVLSVGLTVGAATIGFVAAVGLACARRSSKRYLRWPAACWVEVLRNTPLIVQLFFIAFGIPMLFGFRWPFVLAGLVALSINFSAYYAEIVRAGLDAIGHGQRDAARALGLSRWQSFRRVLMPQAIGAVYPALVSQFVFLFLTTGIISEIGIEELTWAGRFVADRTFRDFEVYLVLTAAYVGLAVFFRSGLSVLHRIAYRWRYVA